MSLSYGKKMEILLEQLHFSDQIKETYFQSSELRKLVVYKKRKIWHFHVWVEAVLPFEIYRHFYDSLQESFQEIATVRLTIEAGNQVCNETELLHYWNFFIDKFPQLLPNHLEILKQKPTIAE